MKLLFITQKIHTDDDDLAFTALWVQEFIRQGYDVEVICLEKGTFDDSFPVHSLGKENGAGKLKRILTFFKYIFSLKYDRVFVHMNPEYITLGGWWWFLTRKPIFLWYTHYDLNIHMRMAGWLCKRMFGATPQSMPQFEGNPKKVVTGHGIDVHFWAEGITQSPEKPSEYNLLTVHRLCRSKRLELGIQALLHLPEKYTLTVYGPSFEKDYVAELHELVKEKKLEDRVTFMGSVPTWKLKEIYPNYRLMVNMAMETIDKTMVESMMFGIYPITTPGNSEAIGLPEWPKGESPQEIAEFIESGVWESYSKADLAKIVKDNHSLSSLVSNMAKYIK